METTHNPVCICPRCDKEYILENVITTGRLPLMRVCDKCRANMKKTTVTIITYEDGFREISGECDICKQFPCEHCPPDVTLVSSTTLRKIRRLYGQLLEPILRTGIDAMIEDVLNGNLEPTFVPSRLQKSTNTRTKQYPHVANYITAEAIEQADDTTMETWEHEATLCDSVIATFQGIECPWCGSRIFKIGDTVIDFNFPFVDSRRIRTHGLETSKFIECGKCILKKKMVSV